MDGDGGMGNVLHLVKRRGYYCPGGGICPGGGLSPGITGLIVTK